ncbi:MAG: gamma-glutamylcyclotransferase [Actinobacteria bacterium]|nr:gamma-glutamylcyclotransferase [Actinomycetota bacterium]
MSSARPPGRPGLSVFAYGSLLNPDSLRRTLPAGPAGEVTPAILSGYRRGFTVAFPNDGSQSDKAYFDLRGRRPSVVLFADIVPCREPESTTRTKVPAAGVNGVLLPVRDADLARLRARERRYRIVEVTDLIRPWPDYRGGAGRVVAFVGRPEFRGDRGVVPEEYLRTIETGVDHWEARCPGFAVAYHASTQKPPLGGVVDLQRVDLPQSSPTPSGRTDARVR